MSPNMHLEIELVHLQLGLNQCLSLGAESTISDALAAAALVLGPENTVGIFGEIKPLDYRLQPGDRLEIYSPLYFDPKLKRMHKVDKTTLPRRCT